MQTMTLLKWQLQRPTRNETKFQPNDSIQFCDNLHEISNHSQSILISKTSTINESSIQTLENNAKTMDKLFLKRKQLSNFPSPNSKQDYNHNESITYERSYSKISTHTPLYSFGTSPTIKSEAEPYTIQLNNSNDVTYDTPNTKIHQESSDSRNTCKLPTFYVLPDHPNQIMSKPDLHSTSENMLSPQDLSKSFPPPYQHLVWTSPDRKRLSSSPSSPTQALLSPPLSLSSLSSSSLLSSPSSSTPTIPFQLFSRQQSSLFPIAFPTASKSSPLSDIPHSRLDKDNHAMAIQHSTPSAALHLPLTPPSPPPFNNPPFSHNIPSLSHTTTQPHLQNDELNPLAPTNFQSPPRKRRHSTTPIPVDTSIPFSTYLQNLTKTLQASVRSKSISSSPHNQSISANSTTSSTQADLKIKQPEPDSSSSDNILVSKSSNHHQYYRRRHQSGNSNSDELSDEEIDVNHDKDSSSTRNVVGKLPYNKEKNHFTMSNKIIDSEEEGNDEDGEENDIRDDLNNHNVDNECDNSDKDEDITVADNNEELNDTQESSNQIDNMSREKKLQQTKVRYHRREKRFKRLRHISELYIPDKQREEDEYNEINKGEQQDESNTRHPLSAPVLAESIAPSSVNFPSPTASLYQQYQSFQETSLGKAAQNLNNLLPHLPQRFQHQEQQQHQQLPSHPHHRLTLAMSSIPLHVSQRSPPPLLQSQFTPPGSQFNPGHIYNKLFPGIGVTSPHHSNRFTGINAPDRAANVPGSQVPGTSGFFTSQLLGLGGLGMRRSSSDKPPPVKKYKCDVCQKAFSRSNTLVTHKRIHTGDKPFKCEICGRAFRQPGNLTRHRLTHTTHKPYVCHVCGKAFNRASNLNTHIRTHNSFRQFGCTVCPKTSFHHGGDTRPYKCDICGRCFAHTTTLLAHRRTHVGI